jgi:hypothetical protein
LVSSLGIKFLNAKTPIEAVTEALTENLELPSEYSIEINKINKSFLRHQVIENISIKKNDSTFLSLDDVELNQSIWSYIKIIFGRQKTLDIKVGNIAVNYNENFSDLGIGFSGLKIKDGTFSRQDITSKIQAEKIPFNIVEFRSDLAKKGSLDLSSYIPSFFKGIAFNIEFEKGSIFYDEALITLNGKFNSLNIKIDDKSYLESINTEITNTKFKSKSSEVSFDIDDVLINLDRIQLNIKGSSIFFAAPNILASVDDAALSYSLLDLESGNFKYNGVYFNYNEVVANIKQGESKLISNLTDVSIYNTFDLINVQSSDLKIDVKTLELDASYVDKKSSMKIISGTNNFINLKDNADVGFSNLSVIVSSNQLLPTNITINAPDFYFDLNKNTVGLKNLDVIATSDANSSNLFDVDGDINFSSFTKKTLIECYDNLKVTVSGKSYGTLKTLESDFEGTINSSFFLDDDFKFLTATIELDDNNLSKIDLPIDVSVAYQGPLSLEESNLKMIEAKVVLGNNLSTKIVASSNGNLFDSKVEANIELASFNPNCISYYLDTYSPFIANYISESTTFDGSLNFSGNLGEDYFLKSKGSIDSSLVINNLVFGKTPINIGLSLSSKLLEQSIDFDKVSINSFGYRLYAGGSYSNLTKIPDLNLYISKIESDEKLITSQIYEKDDEIAFDILVPQFDDFKFAGEINNFTNKDINFDTVISFLGDSFPLTVDLNRETYILSANSGDNLDFSLQVGKTINAKLSLNDLFIISLDDSFLNGDFTFDFEGGDDWNFTATDLLLKYNKDKILFGFDTLIDKNEVKIENILYQNNSTNKSQTSEYNGSFYYKRGSKLSDMRFTPYSLNISLGDGRNQNMDVVASTKGYTNHIYIDVNNVNFAPIFQLDDDLIFNLRLIGNRDVNAINNFNGSVNLFDRTLRTETEEVLVKESNRVASNFIFKTLSLLPFIDVSSLEAGSVTNTINNVVSATNFSFESNIEVEGNDYSLSSINIKTGDLNVSDATLSYNSKDKEIGIDSTLSHLKHSKNTNQISSADLSLTLNFASLLEHVINLYKTELVDENNKIDFKATFNKGREIIKENRLDYSLLNGIYGSLKLDNIAALKDAEEFEKFWEETKLDEVKFSSIDNAFVVENSVVKIDGKNLNGFVNLNEKLANIVIDKEFGIGLNAEMDYSNNRVDLMLEDIYFPMNLLSKLLYLNIIKFYDGAIKGNLQITDLQNNPKFYGTLFLDKSKLKILWLGNQEVTAYNAQLIAFGNQFYAKNIDATVYNSEDNSTSYASADLSIDYIKSLPFEISVTAKADDYVKAFFPLISAGIWSEGYAKDTFTYARKNNWNFLSGHLIVKDAEVTGELKPLPSWLKASSLFTADIDIETENNVTINYPTLDNPILKATLEKGQKVNFYVDKKLDENYAQGTLSIAQGEIFYFQKNFFINTGQIKLNRNNLTDTLDILLSLNATLKDFDADGNSVDIILTLNNSTLDNISPVFSASPAKTQNEIISILGESLTGSQSTADIKVSGLATAATSIFSTLGFLNTGGISSLNQTIAKTLNLDIFSLSSNIVENLLLDTINIDSSNENYSPLAKYLNNTSIYMGKYISNTSYFQLIINLLADSSSDSSSFLASDLSLGLEVTYDIDTPLAKFSLFTNPTQLSIIDILDTIGLSVTKTFQLR